MLVCVVLIDSVFCVNTHVLCVNTTVFCVHVTVLCIHVTVCCVNIPSDDLYTPFSVLTIADAAYCVESERIVV